MMPELLDRNADKALLVAVRGVVQRKVTWLPFRENQAVTLPIGDFGVKQPRVADTSEHEKAVVDNWQLGYNLSERIVSAAF